MSFIGKVSSFLSFGAVKFNPVPKQSNCGVLNTFCQPTELFDDISFQFEVSESTELITNGSFVSLGSGWTTVGWAAQLVNGNNLATQVATVNSLSQKGILTVNDYYRVRVTVSNYPGGSLVVGGGTGSSLFNGVILTQGNGSFEGYFQYNEPAGAGDFIIQGSAGSSIGIRVDDVSVIKISDITDYSIEVINQEDKVVIDTVPAANMRIVENLLTVDFNWTDDVTVTSGCRQIQVIDNTNLFEDNMSTNQGWAITSDITFPGAFMLYTSTGVAGQASIDNVFVPGETYEFTLTTTSMTGTGSVFIQCGRSVGTTRTTNGTFVENIACLDTGTVTLRFDGGALSTAAVTTLNIKKLNNIAGRSECYDLQSSHDCTLLFKWSNNESWGGFDYSTPAIGSAFEQQLRVEANFRGAKYPTVKDIGEDSAGLKTMDYVSMRKARLLDIHRAPDYIHDAMAAMFSQDNRTIEDDSYVLVDEYEPSAPNDSRVIFKDLMTARLELEPSDQPNLINRNVD